jgi:hypothetical protein
MERGREEQQYGLRASERGVHDDAGAASSGDIVGSFKWRHWPIRDAGVEMDGGRGRNGLQFEFRYVEPASAGCERPNCDQLHSWERFDGGRHLLLVGGCDERSGLGPGFERL